jgi:protein TonB
MSIFCNNETTPLAHPGHAPGVLLAFVAFSTIVHGISFLFASEANTPTKQQYGTTMISAVLSPVTNNPPAHPAASVPQANLQQKPAAASTTRHVAIQQHASVNRVTPTQATPPPQANPTKKSSVENIVALRAESGPSRDSRNDRLQQQATEQRNYLLGEVQNRLSRYLTYPQRARRRGWQGEVMVAFHINNHGRLKNVHLAKSSGYSLLDNSAIAAISKLDRITLPEKLKPLQAMELLLPVSYQLREG